jgi:hypothetical protein
MAWDSYIGNCYLFFKLWNFLFSIFYLTAWSIGQFIKNAVFRCFSTFLRLATNLLFSFLRTLFCCLFYCTKSSARGHKSQFINNCFRISVPTNWANYVSNKIKCWVIAILTYLPSRLDILIVRSSYFLNDV